jgi:hypothetical protein
MLVRHILWHSSLGSQDARHGSWVKAGFAAEGDRALRARALTRDQCLARITQQMKAEPEEKKSWLQAIFMQLLFELSEIGGSHDACR